MSRYIDADEYVTVFLYDDEREEEYTERMTIAESLDHFTDEGCPQTINAVEVVHGKWIKRHGTINCSVCKRSNWSACFEDTVRSFNFCPNCGAKMDGERKTND